MLIEFIFHDVKFYSLPLNLFFDDFICVHSGFWVLSLSLLAYCPSIPISSLPTLHTSPFISLCDRFFFVLLCLIVVVGFTTLIIFKATGIMPEMGELLNYP